MKFLKIVLLVAPIFMYSCVHKNNVQYKAALLNPLVYSQTVKKLNDVVLENNFPPVIASRNYVYANIAAYECIAASNTGYKSLSGQIKHLPPMPKPIASMEVNFNLAALLAFTKVGNAVTFPEGSMMGYYENLKNFADSVGIPTDVLQNTITFSDSVVAAILQWSKKDNYAQTRTAEKYAVQNNIDGRWIPTPPMYAQSLEPHWNQIRPILLDSASEFCPIPAPAFNVTDKNSVYYKSVLEVKNTVDSLTEEQKSIADFWDDNPFKLTVVGHASYATKKFSPPGHWMNIVGIAAKQANADFNKTVAAYTLTSIALFDGFISCWNQKFISNTSRPETVINKFITDSWRPYIQTPPFPSYISGHATISAAAAEVMTNFFGNNMAFKDTSLLEFGIKSRTQQSFRLAAKEAAMSRLYGGIHFKYDNDEGNIVGTKIGEFVVKKIKIN